MSGTRKRGCSTMGTMCMILSLSNMKISAMELMDWKILRSGGM